MAKMLLCIMAALGFLEMVGADRDICAEIDDVCFQIDLCDDALDVFTVSQAKKRSRKALGRDYPANHPKRTKIEMQSLELNIEHLRCIKAELSNLHMQRELSALMQDNRNAIKDIERITMGIDQPFAQPTQRELF